jgi:zinc D-Ala-D-Ala carboxypeptidase
MSTGTQAPDWSECQLVQVLLISAPCPSRTTRRRDHLYRLVTRLLSVALVPLGLVVAPNRARQVACQWALAARFPAENLDGLTPATRAAFEAARTEALWRHGELIGLTDGYRDAQAQARLFADAVRRTGSPAIARRWTLPPHESSHVVGTALDVRPVEGARWLERHGSRHHLYRVYDNEWWHFEYRPGGRPPRLPHPGAPIAPGPCAVVGDAG